MFNVRSSLEDFLVILTHGETVGGSGVAQVSGRTHWGLLAPFKQQNSFLAPFAQQCLFYEIN